MFSDNRSIRIFAYDERAHARISVDRPNNRFSPVLFCFLYIYLFLSLDFCIYASTAFPRSIFCNDTQSIMSTLNFLTNYRRWCIVHAYIGSDRFAFMSNFIWFIIMFDVRVTLHFLTYRFLYFPIFNRRASSLNVICTML